VRKAIVPTAVQTHRAGARAKEKCAAVYTRGVHVGASAQRSTTLTHLLTYSLFTLAVVIVLAAVAGWIVAGRILRPVRRITAAARAASEQNLSQRIALQGPRDELRQLADTFDTTFRTARSHVHQPAAIHRQRKP
jgi:HAMP domain-containing protein